MATTRSLYLIRHAVAFDRGPDWPDDTKRPLTKKGIKKMRRAAKGLRKLDVQFDVLISSPLVRARQTAETVADAFKETPKILEAIELSPEQTPDAVAKMLAGRKADVAIGLVGHEPDLGKLAAWLIGADQPIPFKKGGVARIDVTGGISKGVGRLIWVATPKMLRSR